MSKKDPFLTLGKVIKTKGLKGEVKVRSYAESPESFSRYKFFALKGDRKPLRSYEVQSIRPHKNLVVLKFKGVDDIDQAQNLVGCSVCIEVKDLKDPEQNEYYWHQLTGLEVKDQSGRYLGKISAIISTGSNDVYVVQKNGDELLVPGTLEVVQQIDLEHGLMIVNLPEVL